MIVVTPEEFSNVWRQLFDLLIQKAKHFGLDQSAAEDVVQDIAIEAIRKLPCFTDSEHLKNWAKKVVRFRASRKLPETPIFLGTEIERFPSEQPEILHLSPVLRFIRGVLQQLPVRQREVLERVNAGESSEQIGRAMNIHPSSVRSLKRYALSVIKSKVQQFEDGNKES